MNRREAVKYISMLMGGTMVASAALVNGCRSDNTKSSSSLFTEKDKDFLAEVADTILPETSTPGAKEAGVGPFLALMVDDCYGEKDQNIFIEGIQTLNDRSKEEYGKGFVDMAPEDRHELLVKIDRETKEYQSNKRPEDPNSYFKMMKELTLLGYFTSEIGCTQAQRYIETPGRYDGNLPYKKGDKSWAT